MYKNNTKIESKECLICNEPLLKKISFPNIINHIPLCQNCIQQFCIINKTISFHHYPLTILYEYDDFFRTILFQYKGLYDYALKDVFLILFIEELRKKYRDYIIVCAPSFIEDNVSRGFAPMEEIAKTLHKDVFNGLYKKEKYKQSNLSYEERKKVKDKIGIIHGEKLKGKKVLIIDDVFTSGSTLLACMELVLSFEVESLEFLVLSAKKQIL